MLAWAVRMLVLWVGLGAAGLYLWQGGLLSPLNVTAGPRSAAPEPLPTSRAAAQSNTLVLRADRLGHIVVDGAINGHSTRFLVDTGASFVSLGIDDAAAAGIHRASLRFTEKMRTANGVVAAAPVLLREVRIGQLAVTDVPAVVHDGSIGVALLGMSFLKRLDGYEMRDGQLLVHW